MTESTLVDPVSAGMRIDPEHPALISDSGRSMIFDELDTVVGTFAAGIEEITEGSNVPVAVAHSDRFIAVQLLLAAIRAGAIATPINPSVDIDTVAERLDRGDVEVLITDIEPFQSNSIETVPPSSLSEDVYIEGEDLSVDQPITQLFTSGSTGEPKPIIHTAGNHLAASRGAIDRLDLDTEDRWFDPLGLHHMGGFAPVLRCFPEGITVVLSEETPPDDLLGAIDRTESTIASVVPTMVYRELEGDVDVPEHLRCLLVGGAPLRESLYRRARDSDLPVWASYGLTETVGQVATATPTERDNHPGTVGEPLRDTEVRILDNGGNEVTANTPGRIEIIGPTVSESVASATTQSGAHLETNDIGQLDEAGRLWIFGRVDHAIHTGGETVHPHRIEEVFAEHPSIDDIAVIGMADPEWGERVVAAIVSDASIDPAELKRWAGDRLRPPEVPKSTVSVETIPRTVSGTVDRDTLRHLLEESGC